MKVGVGGGNGWETASRKRMRAAAGIRLSGFYPLPPLPPPLRRVIIPPQWSEEAPSSTPLEGTHVRISRHLYIAGGNRGRAFRPAHLQHARRMDRLGGRGQSGVLHSGRKSR